jgi:trk system potassium uptake protein TrkH
LSQWLGGMGIILFTIAILPLLGIGGMQLFKAEVPGPVADKVQPRLANTARSLWGIYVGLTAAEWLLLKLAGLSGYEALCHAFTTLATGGFSTRNQSVGEFGSASVEWIVTFFMLMAGINFVLHYKVIVGRGREVWRDSELRYFLGVVVVGTVLFAATVHEEGAALLDTIRTAAFQTVALLTTTGYVTADFEVWPHLAQVGVLILLVLGGMSGSTGGGIKSLRTLLAVRSLRVTLHRLIHPHAIRPVKYGGTVVADTVLSGIWAFLTAYMLLALLGTAVVAAHGYDVMTSLTASLTAIGNVGPGLGEVGAYDNFAHLPALAKLVLSVLMLFGRLEIFTILALMSREFWRH